eukprot:6338532-Amphidinium_carterae.1
MTWFRGSPERHVFARQNIVARQARQTIAKLQPESVCDSHVSGSPNILRHVFARQHRCFVAKDKHGEYTQKLSIRPDQFSFHEFWRLEARLCSSRKVIPELNSVGSSRARASLETHASRVHQAGLEQIELLKRFTAKAKRQNKKPLGVLDMDRTERSSNRTLVYVLESQLAAVDLNLQMFIPGQRTCVGGKAFRVAIDETSHVVRWQNERGQACELDCSDEALRSLRVWHITTDQGPKNWACLAHLASSVGCRLTYSIDVAHRIHNDFSLAITSSHLRAIKTEWKLVLSVRSGPFRSQANHRLLQEGAKLMQELGASKQALWRHHYERVCVERRLTDSTSFGEPEHEQE